MAKTAKSIDLFGGRPVSISTKEEGDVLNFLSRTLKAHCLDAEPKIVLEKLRNLKIALDQQEATLSHWPDSPSKDRICMALAKARHLVAQIVDEFGAAAAPQVAFRGN